MLTQSYLFLVDYKKQRSCFSSQVCRTSLANLLALSGRHSHRSLAIRFERVAKISLHGDQRKRFPPPKLRVASGYLHVSRRLDRVSAMNLSQSGRGIGTEGMLNCGSPPNQPAEPSILKLSISDLSHQTLVTAPRDRTDPISHRNHQSKYRYIYFADPHVRKERCEDFAPGVLIWNFDQNLTVRRCGLRRHVVAPRRSHQGAKKGATQMVAPLPIEWRVDYQRLRPPSRPPRPPLPPPSRFAIGLASLTVNVRPSSWVPFRLSIAF